MKWRGYSICLLSCGILVGCSFKLSTKLSLGPFSFPYQGDVEWQSLSSLPLSSEKVLTGYQEKSEEDGFQDSFLFFEKYVGGKGLITFIKDSLTSLQSEGVDITHVSQDGISFSCHNVQYYARLLQYQVSDQWYATQLFIESSPGILSIFSHLTNVISEQEHFKLAFQHISC